MNFDFLTDPFFLNLLFQGLFTTLGLAFAAVFLGSVLALGLAVVRMSKWRVAKVLATAYVELIRGTPIVVQLIIVYAVFNLPVILVGSVDFSLFIPGIITLFINSSAYMSEVVRAGVEAVDKGQTEAGRSLGLNASQTFQKIVLPQAIKNILPALGNEFVTLIKETSVLSFLGVAELTYQGKMVQSATYSILEVYLVIALFYFVLTFPTSKLIAHFERKLKIADGK